MREGDRSKKTKSEPPSHENYGAIVKQCRKHIEAVTARLSSGKYMRLLAILESMETASNYREGVTFASILGSIDQIARGDGRIPAAFVKAAKDAVAKAAKDTTYKTREDKSCKHFFESYISGRSDISKFNFYSRKACRLLKLEEIYTLHRLNNRYVLLPEPKERSRRGESPGFLETSSVVPLDFGQLPQPTEGTTFVGRDEHVHLLIAARQSGRPLIIQFFGSGGFGKSTIVWHWLNKYEGKNSNLHQGLGWSFFSQGQDDVSGITSTDFLNYAVRHFSQFPVDGLSTVVGSRNLERLGQAVADAFVLTGGVMVLDGVETLQYPHQIQNGRVRDPGLASLLRRLKDHAGRDEGLNWLLVVTTRQRIPDLQGDAIESKPVRELPVEKAIELMMRFRLHDERGSKRRLRYTPCISAHNPVGTELEEYRLAAERCGLHPLALVLLASYLVRFCGGKLELWASIQELSPQREFDESESDLHAKRIMRAYARQFREPTDGHLSPLAPACRQVLGLVGLFNRPAERKLINSLRDAQIPGLTDQLKDERLFTLAVNELRRLQLLTRGTFDDFDAHPLIREYFGSLLRKERSQAWSDAHSHLFDSLSQSPPDGLEETRLEELNRLSRAISHGCKAGRCRDAFEIYTKKMIHKETTNDSWKKLSSFSDDLAVISQFFEDGFLNAPNIISGCSDDQNLTSDQQIHLINECGWDLRVLCQFRQAQIYFDRAKAIAATLTDSHEKANAIGNLVRIDLVFGYLESAEKRARELKQLVELWDRQMRDRNLPNEVDSEIKLAMQKLVISAYALWGETLHQLGRIPEAENAFHISINLQKKAAVLDETILTHRVLQYGLFLLDLKRYRKVLNLVAKAKEVCLRDPDKFENDIAFNYLLLGRAYTQAELTRKPKARDFGHAQTLLDQALSLLMRLDHQDCFPMAYLAQADLFEAQADLLKAGTELFNKKLLDWVESLEKTQEICEPHEMQRLLVDCRLSFVRYHLKRGDETTAKRDLEFVIERIDSMRYRRWCGEVLRLAQLLDRPLNPGWAGTVQIGR